MPAPQIQGITSNGPYSSNSQSRRTGPQKVFVYGTLKKGFRNHGYYLKEDKELGTATIEGLMFHLGAYPAINLSERFTRIHGEVYEVTWDKILALDGLEGVGHNFYDRIEAKVEPHGVVWTYIFPHDRAARESWVVTSGVWRGPDTPKVKWGGFGKGVEIGTFATRSQEDEIRIGSGESDYVLRRSEADNNYKLINKKTREVLGSYTYLRDMVGSDGNTKPVLGLPAGVRRPPLPPTQQHPNYPIVWAPPEYKQIHEREAVNSNIKEETIEEDIPQSAKFLGIKYGEA
jgi:gamma-glutamylcyclotransferase (GGCT)/AIG2-like uncharacterized protein YtfP